MLCISPRSSCENNTKGNDDYQGRAVWSECRWECVYVLRHSHKFFNERLAGLPIVGQIPTHSRNSVGAIGRRERIFAGISPARATVAGRPAGRSETKKKNQTTRFSLVYILSMPRSRNIFDSSLFFYEKKNGNDKQWKITRCVFFFLGLIFSGSRGFILNIPVMGLFWIFSIERRVVLVR